MLLDGISPILSYSSWRRYPVLSQHTSAEQTAVFAFYTFYMKCWVIAEFVEQIADIINRRQIFAHDIGNSLLDIREYLQNNYSLHTFIAGTN